MQISEEKAAYLRERQETLARGMALATIVGLPGWQELQDFQKTLIVRLRRELREVSGADPAKALDALRRWQLAEEVYELQNGYVEKSISDAREISGQRTVEEALLMEKMNEQPEPTESRTDPTGY